MGVRADAEQRIAALERRVHELLTEAMFWEAAYLTLAGVTSLAELNEAADGGKGEPKNG